MNSIQIIGASAAILVAASMSFGDDFEEWYGDYGSSRVITGLDNGTETSGYWWSYDDRSDGGQSTITWPVETGNGKDSLDPIIEDCSGVCGTYTLDKGSLTYNPFVGVGFYVAGESEDGGEPTAADASAWGGICISYSVDAGASIEMGLGDSVDKELGFDNPAVSAVKAPSGRFTGYSWNRFQQAGWGTGTITGEEAATKLVSLKFKIQTVSGTTGKFNIRFISPYYYYCDHKAIGSSVAKASLKAQLSGRTLSFGKTVAKAEIVNLQGQVIMAASNLKTMDLSKIQPGVYMVRAEGLSQQIMVK